MKKSFLVLILSIASLVGWSQNETDVLRYSTTDVFGSARFESMAGSFGALGADFSAIQINPAGMARFSSSHFSFSMTNTFVSTNGLYNGVVTNERNNNIKPGVIGVVFTSDASSENRGTLYRQLSLGYTRLKSFDFQQRYEGQNFYSLLDVFANMGYGIDPEDIYFYRPFTTGLAYDVYALDYNDNTFEYESRLTAGDMYHNRAINTSGGMGDFHLGYSENYMNQLYYGGSIGIRRIRYNEAYNHNERLLDTTGVSLREFDYMYTQETAGTGFNLKLGMIYLPVDHIRLGVSFESPTFTRFNDTWSADMTARHDFGTLSIDPQFLFEGNYSYRIRTPMKLRSSFAYIFNYQGAINIDFEYVDMKGGRLSPSMETFDGYSFMIENNEVQTQHRSILNTRIGFEYMILRDFFIRGGYALLPQPYKKSVGNITIPNQTFAAGFGWKINNFNLDVGYRALNLNYDYYGFDPSQIENRTQFKSWMHNLIFTFSTAF
jgi:hypothetical protein